MRYFKPILKLVLDPAKNTYTVHASVQVPNGCYTASGAHLGMPSDILTIPSVESAVLHITHFNGFCTQAIETLEFTIPDVPINAAKTQFTAFVVINGATSGSSTINIPQFPKSFEPAVFLSDPFIPSGARLDGVNAWVDAMPGPGRSPTLIALCLMWAPCSNYQFSIQDLGPFGITGRTLRLVITATRPEVCQRAIFHEPIRFEKSLDDANQFDDVLVELEGKWMFDPLEIIQ